MFHVEPDCFMSRNNLARRLPGSGQGNRVARGTRNPWSGRDALRVKTSRVTPEGDAVLGGDNPGRGGYENSSATQEI